MSTAPVAGEPPRLKTFTHAVQGNKQFVRVEFLASDGTTFRCLLSPQDCADIVEDLTGAGKQLAGHTGTP